MRIAFIYDVVYPYTKGGGERRIYEVARRLTRRGHEVHWYSWRWWNGDDTTLDGIYLHGVRAPVERYTGSGRRAIPEALAFGRHVWRALQGARFDVIECPQFPYFHSFAVRARPRACRAFVMTWYETWGRHWLEYLGPAGLVGMAVERIAMHLPRKLFAISEATREDLVACGIAADRIEVVPNGVDIATIDSVRPGARQIDLVSVGRLIAHKNLDVLLRAVALLRREVPGLTLDVVGDGPERGHLQAVAAELNLGEAVRFCGMVERFDDLIELMKGARIFVHPSTKEGGGSLTLLEANACRLPVVGVDHPLGIDPALLRHGENGLRVPVLTPETLADGIGTLLRDEALRSRFASAARATAEQHDWERIVDQHERIYQTLLTES